MLQRFTQVGEFYVMSKPEGLALGMKNFMDVLIYDEEADRHVKITYRQALEHTGCLDVAANGDVTMLQVNGNDAIDRATVIYKDAAGVDKMNLTQFAQAATKLLKANEAGIVADNLDSANGTFIGNIDAPVVLARPFIEHAMLSAVLTVSGGDTGATIFGPSDMYAAQHTLKNQTHNSRSMLPPRLQILNGVHVISQANLGQHICQDDRRVCLPF